MKNFLVSVGMDRYDTERAINEVMPRPGGFDIQRAISWVSTWNLHQNSAERPMPTLVFFMELDSKLSLRLERWTPPNPWMESVTR